MTNEEFYLEDLKTKFSKINPKEYYLSYSGGRDSHFLYWFIKEYAHIEGIKIIGINTYMEHQEILARIKKNCDKVLLPILKPFEIKEKYGIPLYDLTDELLKEIEKKYNIEVPEVYNYVSRTGCMGCPYGSYKHDTEKELKLITGKQKDFILKIFGESYKVLGIKEE